MAWTFDVNQDADKDGVGSVTAIWNVGLADEFRYTGRVAIKDKPNLAAFATAAKAAQVAAAAKQTAETTLKTLVAAEFAK